MSNKIKIAYHIYKDQFIHIDKAENGLRCNCKCLKCGEKLIARQGEIRDWHFKHNSNVHCEGSQETALHELAKQILVNNSHIEVPKYGSIQYSGAVAEKKLEQIRPDVSAVYNNQPIYFEIFVSHAVDKGKEKFFTDGKHRSMEIDLSNCTTSSFEEINELVLKETANKKVFFWEDDKIEEVAEVAEVEIVQVETKSKGNSNDGGGWWLLIAFLVLIGILKDKRGRRRY